MKNIGLRHSRFKDHPLERRFAEEWERRNSGDVRHGILDYILAEEPNHPRGEVSDRDRQVAATVIQWLGSNVGSGFIDDVLYSVHEHDTALYEHRTENIQTDGGIVSFTGNRTLVDVYLDNTLVGNIKRVPGGYQYFSKGQQEGGEVFASLQQCKNSLTS